MAAPGLRQTRRIERALSDANTKSPVRDFVSARAALADLAVCTLSEAPKLSAAEQVVTLAVPAGDVGVFDWLRAQQTGPNLYWSGRDDGVEVAAVGIADLQTSAVAEEPAVLWERLSLLSDSGPETRYYGGMRFDPSRETGAGWAEFGAHRFVLPRFELRREGGASILVFNLVLPRDAGQRERIMWELENLRAPEAHREEMLPAPTDRMDLPDAAGWRANVETALAAFEEGSLEKVVLARRAGLFFDEDLDPLLLIEKLKARTPGCFHFYFEPEDGVAFLGASPERLYRREGRSIKSEAVAGTRPRGELAADDDELGQELLSSAKDLAEHSYVRVSIEEKLGALCEVLEVDGRASEMKLARGRHLVSRVRGTLREGVTDTDVLRALHPTPAVGGYPREKAIQAIRGAETFDRGWYAGPVGWVGSDAAEFAVGIRSGLARGRELALFSGAGIVAGSVPDEEWAEIEHKIGDFTRVFGLEPAHARS